MYEFFHLDLTPPVARLTLDRPPLNVINVAMMVELQRALSAVADAQPVKALLIGAQGRAFCVGTDIKEHLPPHTEVLLVEFRKVIVQLLELPCPSIAVVQGDTLGGGCELISACDMVVAAEGARFGQPEIKLGVYPPIANVLLPRLIGPRRAVEFILTGEPINAARALDWGLANRVVPAEELQRTSQELAEALARHSGPALRLARRALCRQSVEKLKAELAAMDRHYMEAIAPLADAQEGLRAFLEKREPAWRRE